MASQAEVDFMYTLTDKLFRLSMGDLGDFSGAKYDGDFSLSLRQAQARKHAYVVEQLRVPAGGRGLGLGCGWGGMLPHERGRGIPGVGVTLSTGRLSACRDPCRRAHLLGRLTRLPETLRVFEW